MTTNHATGDHPDHLLLLAVAACCAGPMLAIVVITSVLGVTLGPASASTLGWVAALICIALMIHRHRQSPHPGDRP